MDFIVTKEEQKVYQLKNEMSSDIIENYHLKRPFSSFLPGVSGTTGIPIWCFYTNRGQGVSGFGIKDKNNPIMEFFPANQAYQYINTYGFRTFIKIDGQIIEPFTKTPDSNQRNLGITKDSFYIEEVLEGEELKIRVTYSTLNQLPLGGLIRRVELENTSSRSRNIEVIDGMPVLIPYGITNSAYKEMSNLGRSWMEVSHVETKLPFYNLRSSTSDEAEVEQSMSGYFYMNNALQDPKTSVFYDAKVLFSYKTDLSEAIEFKTKSIEELSAIQQIPENKVPCAFQGVSMQLDRNESYQIDSVIGYATDYIQVEQICKTMDFHRFVTQQIEAGADLVDSITSDLGTVTQNKQLNAYLQQSYLDNILRGGKPLIIGKKQQVCHIYSRKHGDQEREYNFFSLEPKYFSQGNGNYRDINQNRRHDVTFEPRVQDFNIWMFYSLVQSDGYNPLGINGIVYHIEDDQKELVFKVISDMIKDPIMVKAIMQAIEKPFTPGDLIEKIKGYNLESDIILEMIENLLDFASAEIDATFGEGYWSDHFTYNLDLVEDYLSIYPDKLEDLLFKRNDYKMFNSPELVLPRKKRIGKTKDGKIRQFGSLQKKTDYYGKWTKDSDGTLIQTNLFNKMLLLAITKFLNLDPSGMGIEMEANKPGWNDAMNGIPGLLGSGMSESIELLRHLRFMKSALEELSNIKTIALFEVVYKLFLETKHIHEHQVSPQSENDRTYNDSLQGDQFIKWSLRNQLKESYRETTQQFFSQEFTEIERNELMTIIDLMCAVLEDGIARALRLGEGIVPTYWIHDVIEYNELEELTPYGLEAVEPISFRPRRLPYFLEAPARLIKTQSKEEALKLFTQIKDSNMYDKGLHMYKTSESLENETMEIGRIRAFTPGWLERESVFMHMSYKFLLGLAKADLWEQFYQEAETNLIPYLSQEVYGRPTTENSSFIASSVNPDPSVVGQGFVARLSGSTAEVLSMWKLMMVGKSWFQMESNQLTFTFEPHLNGDLFDEEGKCSFSLLSKTVVTYINPSLKDTFGKQGTQIKEMDIDGTKVLGNKLVGKLAHDLRAGVITKITIIFVQ